MGAVLDDLLGAIAPVRCAGCGRHAEPVCRDCLATLRAAPPLPPPPPIAAWHAAFSYEGVTREIVARVKYRNERHALAFLVRCMLTTAPAAVTDADVVTWLPTSTARVRARGFDHAELLARRVARELGLPARRMLRRIPGPPQTGRSAADRRAGPQLRALGGGSRATTGRLLVVDDVATTGGSLAAAGRALATAGCPVTAITCARTARPGSRPVSLGGG